MCIKQALLWCGKTKNREMRIWPSCHCVPPQEIRTKASLKPLCLFTSSSTFFSEEPLPHLLIVAFVHIFENLHDSERRSSVLWFAGSHSNPLRKRRSPHVCGEQSAFWMRLRRVSVGYRVPRGFIGKTIKIFCSSLTYPSCRSQGKDCP
jgi:hypothetical protein